MRRRNIAFGSMILAGMLLCVFYPNLQSHAVSAFHPTQTSIFNGPLDEKVILALRTPQVDGQISREQAIGLAEYACAGFPFKAKQIPSGIIATRMIETEARIRANDLSRVWSTKPVWFVSLAGEWERAGGPPSPDGGNMPVIWTQCIVVIDAESGEWSVVTNGRGSIRK